MAGMGSHQSAASKSVVWLTPPEINEPLGPFGLDPCAPPAPRPWDTAARHISEPEDGLAVDWEDERVWMNPPYGGPAIIGPWMRKLAAHGRGTAMIFARTETAVFFETVWRRASGLLFLEGRLHFHWLFEGIGRPCRGEHAFVRIAPADPKSKARACALCGKAEQNSGAPSVLVAYGPEDADILASCGLSGAFVPLRLPRGYVVAALRHSWVEAVVEWARAQAGPIEVAELYRAFSSHPKARGRAHFRAKLRQSLQRGPFRPLGGGSWELLT